MAPSEHNVACSQSSRLVSENNDEQLLGASKELNWSIRDVPGKEPSSARQ